MQEQAQYKRWPCQAWSKPRSVASACTTGHSKGDCCHDDHAAVGAAVLVPCHFTRPYARTTTSCACLPHMHVALGARGLCTGWATGLPTWDQLLESLGSSQCRLRQRPTQRRQAVRSVLADTSQAERVTLPL